MTYYNWLSMLLALLSVGVLVAVARMLRDVRRSQPAASKGIVDGYQPTAGRSGAAATQAAQRGNARPRIFLATPLASVEPATAEWLRAASSSLAESLAGSGYEVVHAGNVPEPSRDLDSLVTSGLHLISGGDAFIGIFADPSVGMGLALGAAESAGLPTLLLTPRGGHAISPYLAGVTAGDRTVLVVDELNGLVKGTQMWLADVRPRLLSQRAGRLQVRASLERQLPRLREAVASASTERIRELGLSAARLNSLVADEIHLSSASMQEFAALQTLAGNLELPFISGLAAGPAIPFDPRAGLVLSTEEWATLMRTVLVERWRDIDVLAVVDRYFEAEQRPSRPQRQSFTSEASWRNLLALAGEVRSPEGM